MGSERSRFGILLRYSAPDKAEGRLLFWVKRKENKIPYEAWLGHTAFSEYIYTLILAGAKLCEGCTPLDFLSFSSLSNASPSGVHDRVD